MSPSPFSFPKSLRHTGFRPAVPQQTNSMDNTGGQPQFNTNALKDIRLPVSPLAEQARIVAILDRFDALVNDLGSGLPAEIKARRQQYEHYRDKLLSFPQPQTAKQGAMK